MNSVPTRTSPARLALGAVTLLALWFVLCRHLSGEWSVNEQYSYGWFVPFFAIFLLWLRWEDRPAVGGPAFAEGTARQAEVGPPSRSLGEGWRSEVGRGKMIAIAVAIVALLLLLPIRLFEVANPDWRPVSWLHTAVVATLTLLVIWAAGGRAWLRHFAFPICFFFVAVPWISPIEEPIVQGLMRTVAAVATEAITLFGIPARLEGNLIRVNTGLVGVNEACSGVRSLQTSLMIGLLFGELKRFSISKRLVLLFGALAIAVIANFARAFLLVWVAATQDVGAVDRWHDAAGYTIVGVVFLGSLGLSALLGRRRPAFAKATARQAEVGSQRSAASPILHPLSSLRLPAFAFILSLAWLLAVEIGVEAWYRMHERGLVAREQWSARWPEKTAKDFREIPLDERTKRILRFDEGRGARWRMPAVQRSEVGDPAFAEGTARQAEVGPPSRSLGEGWRSESGRLDDAALLYFFRWRPGSNSALLANLHRPDVCLPASGWTQTGDHGIRSYPVSEKLALPFRHFVFAQAPPAPAGAGNVLRQRFAHTFFCLREDRVRKEGEALPEQFAQEPSEWSRRERLSLVAQGRRHLGQQVMEFVLITPNELKPEEAEERFAQALPELIEVESRKVIDPNASR